MAWLKEQINHSPPPEYPHNAEAILRLWTASLKDLRQIDISESQASFQDFKIYEVKTIKVAKIKPRITMNRSHLTGGKDLRNSCSMRQCFSTKPLMRIIHKSLLRRSGVSRRNSLWRISVLRSTTPSPGEIQENGMTKSWQRNSSCCMGNSTNQTI